MPLTDDEIRSIINEYHLDSLMTELATRVLDAEAEVRRLNRYDWLKPDAYEKTAAERDALQARVKVLEEALREIARETELDHIGDRWQTVAAARARAALTHGMPTEPDPQEQSK